jgi:2-succinyl-5-enolpyruvyl-6-hydroxy-3-cyclohexene-1-carboxylate synthase
MRQTPTSASDSDETSSSQDIQATFCATLVDEWVRSGVTRAVVSPGSRSTPMALALANDERIALDVVLDERSASFRAIGIARATGRPAVLLCTSGTAAVEYHAAVVEADLDHVPMIVCTADRPPELHGIGAPQTVDQQFLFGRSVRWFGQLGVPDIANRSAWRSFASRAFVEAVDSVNGCGPVHLNLAFREPLVGVAGPLAPGRPDGGPWHRVINGGSVAVASGRLEELRALMVGRRGIIVAGADAITPGDVEEAQVVQRLASSLGWPILADPRSGLRLPSSVTVSAADLILRNTDTAAALRPEVVLRLGAPWASKVLGQWLGSCDDAVDVLVDPCAAWLDPHRQAAVVVHAEAVDVCRGLLDLRVDETKASPSWKSLWRSVSGAADDVLVRELDGLDDDAAPSEPWIARDLVRALSEGSHLVVSSSMPIRDVEWFSGARSGLSVHANRGANGIDGVVSTILGVASAATSRSSDAVGSPVTVGLLGDLSFLHDAGALASAHGINATLVVIDNAGGGIFQFLPQATSLPAERFEQLFGTEQRVDIANVARGYGVDVIEVGTVAGWHAALANVTASGLRMILVRTNRPENVAEHARLVACVSEAVQAVLPA